MFSVSWIGVIRVKRKLERYGPYILTLIVATCYIYFSDIFFTKLQPNTEKIATVTITLASIFLGFIGVMYGVLISLKDAPLMKKLCQFHIIQDIRKYTQESFYSNWTAILLSFFLIFTKHDCQDYSLYNVFMQVIVLTFMCCTSIRMYLILYEFVVQIQPPQCLKNEIYSPSFKAK